MISVLQAGESRIPEKHSLDEASGRTVGGKLRFLSLASKASPLNAIAPRRRENLLEFRLLSRQKGSTHGRTMTQVQVSGWIPALHVLALRFLPDCYLFLKRFPDYSHSSFPGKSQKDQTAKIPGNRHVARSSKTQEKQGPTKRQSTGGRLPSFATTILEDPRLYPPLRTDASYISGNCRSTPGRLERVRGQFLCGTNHNSLCSDFQ